MENKPAETYYFLALPVFSISPVSPSQPNFLLWSLKPTPILFSNYLSNEQE
jgi:hypothetical protein